MWNGTETEKNCPYPLFITASARIPTDGRGSRGGPEEELVRFSSAPQNE